MNDLRKAEMDLASKGKTSLEVGKSTAASIFQHFIRGYLGRPDLALGLPQSDHEVDFNLNLERVRNHLAFQDVEAAKCILEAMQPSSAHDSAELDLEIARVKFLSGLYEESIKYLNFIVRNPDASQVTLMTTHQLKGRALHYLGKLSEAEVSLLKSHVLSSAYPYANSGFVVKAFLVHLYSETKKKTEAEKFLALLESLLKNEKNSDIWFSRKLIVLRAESHYLRAFGKEEDLKRTLQTAGAVASLLDDRYMIQKCEQELAALMLIPDISVCIKYRGWAYLPSLRVIFRFFPKEVARLEENPVMLEILNELVKGAKAQETLFTTVWKIPFEERHANHLRAMLSKLRKHLPPGALVVCDGIVSLF